MRRQAAEEKSKGIAASNARRAETTQPAPGPRQGPRARGVETKLAEISKVGHGKARRAIDLAKFRPDLLDEVAAGKKKLAAAHHEMMAAREPEAKPTQAKAISPEAIDRWLNKLLSGFDPVQRPEVLRLVSASCDARIEKFSL
jgi:hypothetical protein